MLFTAREAREKVNSLKGKNLKDEEIMIESKIVSAVEHGENLCCFSHVSSEMIQWLKSLGYVVEISIVGPCSEEIIVKW